MTVQPYLNYDGRTEEALEFYKKAVGAEVLMLMRHKDNPEPCPDGNPTPGNKVMHSSFKIGDSIIMASDGGCKGSETGFTNLSLSINLTDEAKAHQYFNALAEGGRVDMPLMKTFWAVLFGLVVDKFGLCWMINVEAKPN
ncbi:MAG: VOC family protein [Verrucomicrobia bacterium]|nr:VOC family protein [Verrucomicrobiota bacterium]